MVKNLFKIEGIVWRKSEEIYMIKKIIKKLVLIFLVINNFFFVLSLAISFPIVFRPFYYYHINYLNLEEETTYTYREIKESYDDVLDYLVLNKEFSTGKLKYSEDGKSHFEDCKVLFTINFLVLGFSLIINILRRIFLKDQKLWKHHICFWSCCLLIFLFVVLVMISYIVGFNKCFDVFHNLFFMGKKNWLFDPKTDEIIKILPKQYFRNCAIVVLLIIGIISIITILKEKISKNNLS